MIFGKSDNQKMKEELEPILEFPFIKKFAFFPKKLPNGKYIWLENYYIYLTILRWDVMRSFVYLPQSGQKLTEKEMNIKYAAYNKYHKPELLNLFNNYYGGKDDNLPEK